MNAKVASTHWGGMYSSKAALGIPDGCARCTSAAASRDAVYATRRTRKHPHHATPHQTCRTTKWRSFGGTAPWRKRCVEVLGVRNGVANSRAQIPPRRPIRQGTTSESVNPLQLLLKTGGGPPHDGRCGTPKPQIGLSEGVPGLGYTFRRKTLDDFLGRPPPEKFSPGTPPGSSEVKRSRNLTLRSQRPPPPPALGNPASTKLESTQGRPRWRTPAQGSKSRGGTPRKYTDEHYMETRCEEAFRGCTHKDGDRNGEPQKFDPSHYCLIFLVIQATSFRTAKLMSNKQLGGTLFRFCAFMGC